MTILSANSRDDYTGNGATSVYPYTFKIFAATDLVVTQRDTDDTETTLVLNTDYTVSGVGDTAGGNVTLTGGNLPASYTLTIRRVRPLTQETDIRNQGDFFPETHEDAFDHQVMLAQQQQDEIDKGIRLPETVSGVSTELPVPVASRYLRWNAAADAIEGVDNIDLTSNPLTTKGDLMTRIAGGNTRLPVGSNGQVIVADSVSAEGIKWQSPAYRDPRADGAVGDGVTSDKTALDLTFANTVVQVPEGTWMGYDLDLSTMSKLSGMGQGSVIKCNSLAASFTVGYQDYPTPVGKSNLTLTDLVIDGNKALGTFTGSGHGLDLRGYDEVYIDRLEVKNAWGHGVIIGNCAKVRIGTLVVHDCDKYGVSFDANNAVGFAEEITIDTLISYSNGGSTYSGISFADITTTPAGSRKVSIGKVYAFSNGRDGIAFGRNATATTTGPSDITVGEIHAYSNGNLGVELFGCKNVTIGSINTYSNTYAGVGIYHGDNNSPTYDYALAENISIGQIITHDNALDGVDIMGAFKLEIGSIQAYNNSIGNTNQYSGVRLRANNPGDNANYNKDIHIGSILAYDDQGTPTQKYGLARADSVHGGHVSIGHLQAYGNATADVIDGIAEANYVDPIVIGEWDVVTILPSYANNIDSAGIRTAPFKVGGLYYGAAQTTDATIRSVVRVPIPVNKMCTVEGFVQCATDSTLANRASYKVIAGVLNDGTNCNVVGSVTTTTVAESNAGMDATITSGGAGVNYVTIQVTGLAATTINWNTMVRVVEH